MAYILLKIPEKILWTAFSLNTKFNPICKFVTLMSHEQFNDIFLIVSVLSLSIMLYNEPW